MSIPLVGDRFACIRPGCWLDLATGEPAVVWLQPINENRTAHPQHGSGPAWPEADVHRLDNGWQAEGLWFEARGSIARGHAPDDTGTAEAVRMVVSRLRRAATAGRAGVQVAPAEVPSGVQPAQVASALARSLRQDGFVTIRASAPVPDALALALAHRHVVVLCWTEADVEPGLRWIRRLAAASPRAHLVADLRSMSRWHEARSPVAFPFAVREGLSADRRLPVRGPAAAAVEEQMARAARFRCRGRGAAAERWLRAAIEMARRRRDDRLQTAAVCQLIDHLVEGDRWKAARVVVRAALDAVRDRHSRLALHGAFARVHISLGELASADADLAGAIAEARLLGETVSPVLRARQGELRFWQGRFEEAEAVLMRGEASLCEDLVAWRGMVAWARGDRHALAESIDRLRRRSGGGSPWIGVLQSLDNSLENVTACGPAVMTGPIGPPSLRRLARACAAEAHLAAGRLGDARRILAARAGPATEAALDEALLARLLAQCGIDQPATPPSRISVPGLARWGMGKTGMHLLHAVPELLHIARDSEDELAALVRGCAWVKTQAGAGAAGIVTADAARLVAAVDLRDADLDGGCRSALLSAGRHIVVDGPSALVGSPVRYGGRTVGFTVVRGSSHMVETLTEAAGALAVICAPALCARLDALAVAGAGASVAPEILGQSPSIAAVREAIARAAATTFPVLIEGESGTGKELVARALHRLSPRRVRRFCAVNCAALTDELVEAELFGYARGAFTGAVGTRAGLFEEASGGTLLLDEVRELSARAQAKLLRAVQEREIRRLGENAPRPVDVRVVAATNQPLADAVGRGDFREDLLFRLAVVRIRVPPLRDRIEDVPLLAQTFWRRLAPDTGTRALLGPDAIAALCRHHWPGNVRELQNIIAGLIVVAPSRGRMNARHVGQALDGSLRPSGPPSLPLDAARRSLERRMIAAALARHAGRRTAAARELGLTRQGLTKAIRRLGLAPSPARAGVA